MSQFWTTLSKGKGRLVAAIVLLATALGGCNSPPVVRGDTEKNFRKTLDEIARRAPPEKIRAFDHALRTIVLARAFSGEAERHSHFVSFTDSSAGARVFMSPLQDWSTSRPSIVVARIGRLIDGKTVDEVIELGAREKAAFDERMERWAARQTATPDVDWSLPQAPRKLTVDEADRSALQQVTLNAVAIINASSGEKQQAMLSFIVENLSTKSIRAITIANRSALDAGEADPGSVVHYVMPAPLLPGARRRIVTRSDIPAGLTKDAVVVGIEMATGQRTGMTPLKQAAPRPPLSISHVAVNETPLTSLRAITR